MISKKTVYYYVLLSILIVPIFIATQFGYHTWITEKEITDFNIDKSFFSATIASTLTFIVFVINYKDKNTATTN